MVVTQYALAVASLLLQNVNCACVRAFCVCVCAVSYTHLDVYKRQAVRRVYLLSGQGRNQDLLVNFLLLCT